MNDKQEHLDREVQTSPQMMSMLQSSEIDMQIATAHKFPRSIKKFRDTTLEMVTLSESIAQECIYALKRGDKVIEGPGARFAEIVASAWGNCRAGSRVVNEGGEFVTAQGVFHDLERNVAITYEVQRRITDKYGKRYNADMIGVTANAACSIALRNAILKGVPKAFWADTYAAARRVIAGDVKTLGSRRDEAIKAFAIFGVTPEMIYKLLEVKGKEDITIEHLVILKGTLTALQDGDTTVEQTFTQDQKQPVAQPQRKSEAAAQQATAEKPAEKAADNGPLKESQIKLIKAKVEASGSISEADLFAAFGAGNYIDIKSDKANDVLEWIKKNG